MKRLIISLLCITLISSFLLGCGSKKSPGGESVKADKTAAQSKSSDAGNKNDTGNKKPISSKVFKPNELLSAEEVAKILGTNVTIQGDTLNIDSETGISKTYYTYDFDKSTTIDALFLLKQNGAIPKDKLSGNTAEDAYNDELKFCDKNAESKSGLGNKAFIHKIETQVNVLYGDYYFLVGFNGSNDDKGREINLAIAKKIIENIDKKK